MRVEAVTHLTYWSVEVEEEEKHDSIDEARRAKYHIQ